MNKRWILITLFVVGIVGSLAYVARADQCRMCKEQKIQFSKAPAAVQKTMTREAEGCTIKMVDKEMRHGRTAYEADVKIDGKKYEMKVAEDGTLLVKRLDMEWHHHHGRHEWKHGWKHKDKDND